ncbi:hypothetical protein QJS66_01090 [Kocuria rhizophila]|nr:hypothetical protein QJS66_01090 [Kocuria rhizophila]
MLVARFEEIRDRRRRRGRPGSGAPRGGRGPPAGGRQVAPDDLLGLVAVDLTRDEARIGTVRALIQGSAQDLLEVAPGEGPAFRAHPFVEEIVPEVDLDRGWYVVTRPVCSSSAGRG